MKIHNQREKLYEKGTNRIKMSTTSGSTCWFEKGIRTEHGTDPKAAKSKARKSRGRNAPNKHGKTGDTRIQAWAGAATLHPLRYPTESRFSKMQFSYCLFSVSVSASVSVSFHCLPLPFFFVVVSRRPLALLPPPTPGDPLSFPRPPRAAV